MRISTSMLFDAGVQKVNDQTASMLKLQQQISTGRRIVSPSDDPVAAARVLELTQSSDVVAQFSRNRDNAQSALSLQESQLTGVGEVITRTRELAVQLGNGSLTKENRQQITVELRSRFEELLGYANARDGSGKYIFSGYMGDTRPYTGSVETGIQYFGDDGQRQLQVSPSRVIEVSDSGRSIFERIKEGNGYFVTGPGIPAAVDPLTNAPLSAIANKGSAVIDAGTVTDVEAWRNSAAYQNARIQFSVDVSVEPPKTYYDIVVPDPAAPQSLTAGVSLLTGGTIPTAFANQRAYVDGQAIDLTNLKILADPNDPTSASTPVNMGANLSITGEPIALKRDPATGRPIDPATGLPVPMPPAVPGFAIYGDVFTIRPAQTQDIFETLRNLVIDAEQPTGTSAAKGLLGNKLGLALTNLDQAEQNILRVRSLVGSRLNEVESLQSVNEDLGIQYQQAISGLQDLDYAKAISDFTRKQTDLQAAQQSFMKISQLSLFNYM